MTDVKCAIMQPTYIPWLGYFYLIDLVDIFVFLDDVKLEKQSWQVRNRIKVSGKEQMLTIPTLSINGMVTKINQSLLDDRSRWRKKHIKTIEQAYSKANFKGEIIDLLTSLFNSEKKILSEMTISIIEKISKKIGINTEIIRSSELDGIDGLKDFRVFNICKKLNCENYISPIGSMKYINRNNKGGAFANSTVKLHYMIYKHPVYNQIGEEFLPYMSIIDLLLNYGFEDSLKVIRCGHKEPIFYDY